MKLLVLLAVASLSACAMQPAPQCQEAVESRIAVAKMEGQIQMLSAVVPECAAKIFQSPLKVANTK